MGLSDSKGQVVAERRGCAGLITLHRPEALNALNLPMVRNIRAALESFAADPDVSVVVLCSASEKSFCAGGDIRLVTSRPFEEAAGLFAEEYRLNYFLATYSKPLVSVVDGLCMGGGVGLSAHGDYCLATERALFSMPEMAIGLFPDVGSVHVLAQAEVQSPLSPTGNSAGAVFPGLAAWFVLTGARLKEPQAELLGLCSGRIRHQDIELLIEALAAGQSLSSLSFVSLRDAPADADQAAISGVVEGGEGIVARSAPFSEEVSAVICEAFSAPRVEEIIERLERCGSEWALSQKKLLDAGSPTSLKMGLWHLRLAQEAAKDARLSEDDQLREVLERDLRLACFCLKKGDFREGVRAVLVDRDKAPRWSPAILEAVDETDFMSVEPPAGNLFGAS